MSISELKVRLADVPGIETLTMQLTGGRQVFGDITGMPRGKAPTGRANARPMTGSALLRARCPGHPRLNRVATRRTWMAGTSPAMTEQSYFGRLLNFFNPDR